MFCAAESSRVMDTMRGRFIRDRKVERSVEQMLNISGQEGIKLWEVSEQIVQNIMRKYSYM